MALHADCMSGYQFSLRQPALQQLSLMIKIFDKARALGDFSNISPDPNARLLHHGTPEERAQAFNNGVNLAQQYAARNHGSRFDSFDLMNDCGGFYPVQYPLVSTLIQQTK